MSIIMIIIYYDDSKFIFNEIYKIYEHRSSPFLTCSTLFQVKKANKWTCKVCGEKQSISKIYGQGRAPDCRRHVQKLNTIQGEREQLIGEKVMNAEQEEFDRYEDGVSTDAETAEQEKLNNEREEVGSKWEKFIETEKKSE